MVLRCWWLSLLVLSACFSPRFQDGQIACGSSGECPPGLTCVDGLCRQDNVSGQFALTVTLGGDGMGTVTSEPAGINCGTDCSAEFAAGTMVTLTATATDGSTFVGWNGPCSGRDPCTVTVDAAVTVGASFAPPNSVTVLLVGDGLGAVTSNPAGIDCGTQCAHQFASGTMVTLTASVMTGSSFDGWSGSGCTGTAPCTVTVGSAQAVVAAFSKIIYPLTVLRAGSGTGTVTGGGIDCGSTCNAAHAYNDMVTLTATPDAGSVFAGWSGGGCTGTAPCDVTIVAATSVTATFTAQHTLTVTPGGAGNGSVVSNPTGINCGTDCTQVYNDGQVVTLTPTAAGGSTFAGWSGCDSTSGNVCTVNMTSDRTVTPTFAIATYTLSVTTSPTAGGDVISTSDNNINCGATCSGTYAANAMVTLQETPRLGYAFSGWSGACTGNTATCTVTMNASKSVTATFQAIPTYMLTVTKSGNGSGSVTSNPSGITCGADCTESYNNNTSVVLTATPSQGSTFDGWSGACTNMTGTCTVTMTQARSVGAVFTAIPPNYAFVTSTTQSSNYGGLAGADMLCQTRAQAAGLPGTYRAFLSTSTVNAIDRFAGARGWVRTDGKPFLDKITDITTSDVLYPVRLDELKNDVGSSNIATGSNNIGTLSVFGSCNDWTSASFSTTTACGYSDTNSYQVAFGCSRYCGDTERLLCMGIDHQAVVTVPPVNARRAFTTDGTWTPGGGLASADALCQSEASSAGLSGIYLALLPTSTASAISRFPTGASALPWARRDNVLLAGTAATLAMPSTTYLDAMPNNNADGTQFWAAQGLWGGGVSTLADVATSADTCMDWTSGSSTNTGRGGQMAYTSISLLMSGFSTTACNTSMHLICLQK